MEYEVIDLSSESNDSVPSYDANELLKTSENYIPIRKFTDIGPIHAISDDEFDFPEVPFASIAAKRILPESEPPLPKFNCEPSNNNIEDELLNKYLSAKPATKATAAPKINKKKGANNINKELSKLEKLKKAEEAAQKKAEKTAAAKRLNTIKPGECMKYINVILDSGFQYLNCFENLMTELRSSELKYRLKSQIISNSVTWERTTPENFNTADQFSPRQSISEEKHMLIVWDYAEVVKKVSDDTFVATIMSIEELRPRKSTTLIIYGIENYFRHHKNAKKNQVKNVGQGNAKNVRKRRVSKAFDDLPVISKKELEMCLAEIQLRINCNNQFIETPEQLGLLIYQYTKAIAEDPFKKQKKEAAEGQLDWYCAGDKKDTVRVDKDGNGLKRLWQQQLCQFNLAKLEIAEAIISQYPTPVHLMEAYDRCTPSEGSKLLEDIVIRRTAGPLTATRRIGPELSKKLYLMFTAEDGDVLLGNE